MTPLDLGDAHVMSEFSTYKAITVRKFVTEALSNAKDFLACAKALFWNGFWLLDHRFGRFNIIWLRLLCLSTLNFGLLGFVLCWLRCFWLDLRRK